MKYEDLKEIVFDIYRELYQNSEPKGNFDTLMKISPKDETGRILIPFMDYEITQENLDNIINKHLIKHKLSGPRIRSWYKKRYAEQIKIAVYLGCSPKTKK